MSHAFAGRSASSAGGVLEKGRVDVTKVKRYWRGRAPEWIEEPEADDKEQKRETAEPVIISKTADPRLERLSLSEVNKEATVPIHRRRQIVTDIADVKVKEEKTESVFERRAQLRLKLLETRKDEPALLSEEEDEEETSSDEYESDDEAETPVVSRRPLLKPVFISAEARDTIQERIRLEEEEEREWEAQKQKLQQRREDTRLIVAQKIKDEEEALQNREEMPTEAADINTDDDVDEEDVEFETWKKREMDRIKRDKEEMLITEKYAQEREKLKNMTDEERRIYDELNPKVSHSS